MAQERKYSTKMKDRKSFWLMYNSLEVLSSSSSGSGNTISSIENQRNFFAMPARLIGIAIHANGLEPRLEQELISRRRKVWSEILTSNKKNTSRKWTEPM